MDGGLLPGDGVDTVLSVQSVAREWGEGHLSLRFVPGVVGRASEEGCFLREEPLLPEGFCICLSLLPAASMYHSVGTMLRSYTPIPIALTRPGQKSREGTTVCMSQVDQDML